MGYKEKLAQEAQNDINAILEDATSNKKRANFQKGFNQKVGYLKDYPESAPTQYKDFRVATFIKLPFKLVYKLIKPSTLFVIAIFHQKRDPDHWQNRADKYEK